MKPNDHSPPKTEPSGAEPSASPPPPQPPPVITPERPGATFGDRYHVERELGRGGIGIVYLARDTGLMNRLVVIKVIQDEMSKNDWVLQKFRQETEALTRLNHPGIVAVYDAGETPEGQPYIVMQYVEGTPLRSVMTAEGMPLERVAYVMRRVGRALSAAHDRGVLHRDLKPENVMLESAAGEDEEAKLIDFGIAKIKDSVVAPSTLLPMLAGTIAYMSPEQLERRSCTAASDIYSLGVMAYEMVTGRRPFNPETQFQLLELQRAGVRVKPCDLRPALSVAAQEAILKALEFEPQRRFASARDFGDTLAQSLNVAFATEAETHRFDEANKSNAAGVPPPPPPHHHLLPPTQLAPPPSSGSSSATGDAPHANDDSSLTLDMAYVFFADIVGYSLQPTDQQSRQLRQLQDVVRHTRQFATAHAADQLVKLPTGDGMALVFFTSNPLPAVECALEVARRLRGEAQTPVRIGIHAGPVYRVPNISSQNNVAGGGIDTAQRVMNCGDAGHVLVSQPVAEVLQQLNQWRERLHDLGEAEVVHGARIRIYNLFTADAGNPETPAKLVPLSRLNSETIPATAMPPKKSATPKAAVIAGALAVLVLIISGALFWLNRSSDAPATSNQNTNAATTQPVERTLNFWLTVQKMKDGREDGAPFQSEGRDVFTDGWRFRLNVSSKDAGHLYLLNESPATGGSAASDEPRYQILFPSPQIKSGDARLPAAETVTIPSESWYFFTGAKEGQRGTEKMWMVWSKDPLPTFEDLKNVPAEKSGVRAIGDPKQTDAVQKFLTQNSTDMPVAERDRQKRQNVIRGKGDTVVNLIELEHQ